MLATDIDALQTSFDGFLDERFDALRRALDAPDGFPPDLPVDKLKAAAAEHPESYRRADGARPRAAPDRSRRRHCRRSNGRPRSCRWSPAPKAPTCRSSRWRSPRATRRKAAEALERLTAQDHTDVDAARQLVGLLDPTKDRARLRIALQRVVAVDPFDAPVAHARSGAWLLHQARPPEAIRMFRVAIAAGPIDRASAHADLAEGLFRAGQRDEAKREALAALEIAPTYERAQDLLLKLVEGAR